MEQVFNSSQRLVELWTDLATRMAAAGMSADANAAPTESARATRSAIFGAMSQFADQTLR